MEEEDDDIFSEQFRDDVRKIEHFCEENDCDNPPATNRLQIKVYSIYLY